MPSVDRVGRYFPLTIARPLGEGPATALQMTALWHWLGRLDDLAADALEDDWPIDRLDAELGRMAAPELDPDSATAALPGAEPGTLAATALDGSLDAGGVIAAEAQALWRAAAAGRAYWYASSEIAGRRLIVSRGLPAPERLNALLGAKD
jgi:type VI secretion system protein ImpM